jgi:hypothetical protein
MLSLNVAAERADLAGVERKIIAAKQEIRSLNTELGTRGRLAQLDRWNADVLALSSPTSAQFLQDEFTLARFDRHERTVADGAQVRMAAMEVKKPVAKPEVRVAAADYEAAGAQAADESAAPEPRTNVRHASFASADAKPFQVIAAASIERQPAVRRAGLLDPKLMAEIGAAASGEKKKGGGAGNP